MAISVENFFYQEMHRMSGGGKGSYWGTSLGGGYGTIAGTKGPAGAPSSAGTTSGGKAPDKAPASNPTGSAPQPTIENCPIQPRDPLDVMRYGSDPNYIPIQNSSVYPPMIFEGQNGSYRDFAGIPGTEYFRSDLGSIRFGDVYYNSQGNRVPWCDGSWSFEFSSTNSLYGCLPDCPSGRYGGWGNRDTWSTWELAP